MLSVLAAVSVWVMFLPGAAAGAVAPGVITSGVEWADNAGNPVNAHGGGMIKVDDTYYWIGEHKGVDGAFLATACYSSTDLQHWTFVNYTLRRQGSGDLGPNRVVERPKILYNRATNQYVQTMHVDDLNYDDQAVGVATSSTVCGDYTYRGRMKLNGSTLKYWDSGSFQDSDGSGYIITHNGNVFRLAPDYLSAVSQPLSKMCSNCESPALFKAGDTYFFLFSRRTGWATNDNIYFTATSLAGPWTARGNLAPAGTKTWDSQTTYVLPVQGSSTTTYIFMGDRWNATNLGTSTYVWQPLVVNGTSLSMPTFHASWTIDTATGRADTGPTGTHYRVTNRNSGRVMDVVDGSTTDRAEVKQHSWQGGRNQTWEFRDVGDGYVRIVNRNSGKCLDVSGASRADGANVIQFMCGSGMNQQWQWTATGSYFQLRARHSGKCLDVVNADTGEGADIQQLTCAAGTNQQWTRTAS